jgi:hypothetical protein
MEVGAYANAGSRVAHAIRTDQLELEVSLRRTDAAWVRIGDPVTVTSKDGSADWEGYVIRKSDFVDENTQRQEVFVRLDNGGSQALLAGEYLLATFPVRPINDVMEIPRNAVFNFDEVFLVKSGRLAKANINVIKENERTLIFNGLNEGDTLVIQQLINVSEGTLVMTDADQESGTRMGQGRPGQPQAAAPAGEGNQGGESQKKDQQPERINRSAQN